MLTMVYGDLLTSPARVLVNPVNTVGTMAGPLGEDLRQVYPQMFAMYQRLCEEDRLNIGQVMLYRTSHKWILNLPVKRHYRATVRLEALESALRRVAALYAEQHFASISLPAAELAEGEIDDQTLMSLLRAYFGTLPIMVYVHLPPDPQLQEARYNITTLMRWLQGTPQHVTFETFWRGIASIVRRHPQMTTFDTNKPFSATFRRDEQNPRLMSLKLIRDEETTFIPQTLLRDLWQYVLFAGYAHPQHLPGGLDTVGDMIVALLSKLSYMRPVRLQPSDQTAAVGLHYIPPVTREPLPITAVLE
jgi:hypothetical protein